MVAMLCAKTKKAVTSRANCDGLVKDKEEGWKVVEEKVTPEERVVFEEWRNKIDQEFTPVPVEDVFPRCEFPYFFRWGAEAEK